MSNPTITDCTCRYVRQMELLSDRVYISDIPRCDYHAWQNTKFELNFKEEKLNDKK